MTGTNGSVLPARTEEQIVAAVIPTVVGGKSKLLRILTMRESRTWKAGLVDAVSGGIGSMDLSSSSDFAPVLDAAADKILELVVAYDVDGSLGGREWLETNATDAEVYLVLRRCLEVSFPFVKDLRTALAEIRALGLAELLTSARPSAESRPASSGSGASPDGASTSTDALLTSS